jgi:hypothetical protein
MIQFELESNLSPGEVRPENLLENFLGGLGNSKKTVIIFNVYRYIMR